MISEKIYNIYKTWLSPVLKYTLLFPEAGCKFYPTCSEYTHLAIKKHGIIKGTLKGLYRLLRCSPLTKGGIDYP